MANESKIQKSCINYLEQLESEGKPVYHFRRDATGRTYKKGLPDLFVIVGPYHLEIEMKDPEGGPTPLQEMWERKFKKMGTPYLRCHDTPSFITFIEKYLSRL